MDYSGKDLLDTLKQAKNYNNFLVSLISQFKDDKPQKIVDFGSGTGSLSEMIACKMDSEIQCVEVAENLKSCYQNKPRLILYDSIDKIQGETVDILYSFNVLEHIEDDREAITRLTCKLRSGGVLILYLPAFKCLFSSMDVKVGHFRRYNKKMLCALLKDLNLEIKTCAYCDFCGFFVTILYKMIGSKKGDINPRCISLFDKIIFPIGRLIDKITQGRILGKNVYLIAIKK